MHIQKDELLRIGSLLESSGDWSLAGNVYLHLLKSNLQSIDGYAGLSRVLERQEKYSQAVTLLTRGIEKTSSESLRATLQKICEVWLNQPSLAAAEAYQVASDCLEHGFSEPAARVLIRHAAPLGKQLAAVSILERSMEFMPAPQIELIHAMASLAIQGGDEPRARALIDVALERDPANIESLRLFELLRSS